MSGYLSHFFGYVFQIFKKENSKKKHSSVVGNVARKCNSVIEDREIKTKIEKITADLRTSKRSLKRVHSCPQLHDEYIVHTKDGPRCRTCSDKLIILGSTQNNALSETDQDSKKIKPKEISTTDSWNSDGFVRLAKNCNNNSILRRFRSLDFQSFDDENFLQNVKPPSRGLYHSDIGAGDGKYTESKELENCKLNLTQKVSDQSEVESTANEQCCQNNFKPEFSVTKDTSEMELETSGEKLLNRKTFQEPCVFDVSTEIQEEVKKDFDTQKTQLETCDESAPEHLYFENWIASEKANNKLPQLEFYDDIEENEVYATPFQERRLSCRSKIPIHQTVRRFGEGGKFINYIQSGWRRSSRTNLCNWTLRNWTHRGRARRCHARHPTSSITSAYRHQLNSKLDRMFREFSKKIYRGNIMDHSSHSRWMKLAGIVEEENASSFKSYAKSKVVLTLSEYKEALLKMCEDHRLDYWECLKKMTDVKSGKTLSYDDNDDESTENIDEE